MRVMRKSWYHRIFTRFQDELATVVAVLHRSEGILDVGVIEDCHGLYKLKRT